MKLRVRLPINWRQCLLLYLLVVAYLMLVASITRAGPLSEADKERERVRVAIEIARARLHPKPAPVTPAGSPDPYGFTDYAAFVEKVKSLGNRKDPTLIVGIEDNYVGGYVYHCRVPSGFGGLADGEYSCWSENGKAVLELRKEGSPKATPFPSPTTLGMIVPSAGESLTSRPGADRYPARTYTLTGFTGGFTTTANCTVG